MHRAFAITLSAFILTAVTGPARAEGPVTVNDLAGLSPHTLDKAELESLLPGARMGRVTTAGSSQFWSNKEDGTFIVSTDSRSQAGRSRQGSAPGKWHIADDGRYCVEFQWTGAPTESWCRQIIRTSAGYFATGSATSPTAKLFRLEIGGK